MTLEVQQELTRLIGEISLAWSNLETDLTYLFASIIADDLHGPLAAAILHSATSAEIKLTIIDQAFETIIDDMPGSDRVQEAWKVTKRRLQSPKRTRNTAVHGTFLGSDQGIRIAPPTFSPKFWREVTSKTGRTGITANDIRQAIAAIQKLRPRIQLIDRLVRHWREGNTQAYARTFPEL